MNRSKKKRKIALLLVVFFGTFDSESGVNGMFEKTEGLLIKN